MDHGRANALLRTICLGTLVVLLGAGCGSGGTSAASRQPSGSRPSNMQRVAITATHSGRLNSSEARQQFRDGKPVALKIDSNTLRFPLPGSGCRPKGISGRTRGTTLELLLRPANNGCTLLARLYEVTISLSKPVLSDRHIAKVMIRYGKAGSEYLPLIITA